jgi:cation:H+ antiporter
MVLGGLLPDAPAVNVLPILVATAAARVGRGCPEAPAERLAAHYGGPTVVRGSAVVAVGSRFPDPASVVFAGLAGAFNTGVGAAVCSATVDVLVVPSPSGLVSSDDLEAGRAVVYGEARFDTRETSSVSGRGSRVWS